MQLTTLTTLLIVAIQSVGCDILSPEKQLYNFINSGLTQVFWMGIDDNALKSVSAQCSESLSQTIDAIESGEVWPYRRKQHRSQCH